MLLLCGGQRRWLSLDGVADHLESVDEFACSSCGVFAADELVGAEIVVGLVSLEHVEDRHEDAVFEGDEGLGVAQAGPQPGVLGGDVGVLVRRAPMAVSWGTVASASHER